MLGMIKQVLNQVFFGGMIILDRLNHIIQVMNIVVDTIILRINKGRLTFKNQIVRLREVHTSLFLCLVSSYVAKVALRGTRTAVSRARAIEREAQRP